MDEVRLPTAPAAGESDGAGLTPDGGGIERLHRLVLARHLCAGKDACWIVSAMAGQTDDVAALRPFARSLREVYLSAAGLDAGEGSADIVIAFGVLEHCIESVPVIAEFKRVLRPDGLLLLSAADGDSFQPADFPTTASLFNVLSRRTLQKLLGGSFRHHTGFGQRALLGSALLRDEPATTPALVFERRGRGLIAASEGLAHPASLLYLASDAPLPPLADSLFIHSGRIEPYLRDHATAEAARASAAAATAEVARLNQALAEARLRTAALQQARAGAEAARDAMQADLGHALAGLARRRQDQDSVEAQARSLIDYYMFPALLRRLRREPALRRLLGLPRRRARQRQSAAIVRTSAAFDAAWYLEHNQDVRERGLDPALHYVRFGADEGRDPGPDFSTLYYLRRYPDVTALGLNPLEHFELFGRAEGREAKRTAPLLATGALAIGALAPAPERRDGEGPVRILYVSGAPETQGHSYRVLRYAEAARRLGALVDTMTVAEAASDLGLAARAHLVVLWRAEWSGDVAMIVNAAHEAGAMLICDADDLIFDPALARIEIIDGIRSDGHTEMGTAAHFNRMQQTMMAADFCTATTRTLASQMRRWQKPTFVLPNGFDAAFWRRARLALRRRRSEAPDGLLRIGYAGGSRTHQRDFAPIAGAVARVLRARPECRLVLFRRETLTVLDIGEFPELAECADQIEWREMVPVDELADELVRFDVNLAPLQTGNIFCEAKSELKFFEAAMAGVASVCSPTQPFRDAMRAGQTGLLADTPEAWHAAIELLLAEPARRESMAHAAYLDSLWFYGPERRSERMASVLEQTLRRGRRAARAFALDRAEEAAPRPPLVEVPPGETILAYDTLLAAEVTVVIPLYNYAAFVVEALDSVLAQSLAVIDLVVVDDASTDDSLAVARQWIEQHHSRFGRVVLRRNHVNAGLALTRNAGFAMAESRFVLPLDADNALLANCAERLLAAIETSGAAFVYPILQKFGSEHDTFGVMPYDPATLAAGNFIDAMALIRLACWAGVGGYHHIRHGWEDYDLWCRFAEHGLFGQHVAEILAMYRVHAGSMLRTETDLARNKQELLADMRTRHPWALEGRDAF